MIIIVIPVMLGKGRRLFGSLTSYIELKLIKARAFGRGLVQCDTKLGVGNMLKIDSHAPVIKWATDCLIAKGYSLQEPPEILLETPWSKVVRFSTSQYDVYLKQMPPAISLDPKIIQLLANQCQASVPVVIATNDSLNCFLMKDAGINLRAYLKTEFKPELLCQAIKDFTTIQRSTEYHIQSFLALGVPDWRLDKFSKVYDHIINQTDFLKADGMTDNELKILQDLSPKVAEQCELLFQYQIPETLVQLDFNSNNILFDPGTKKMTLIDLGEAVISHPFFSLHNFLYTATIHHGVKEGDQTYQQLQNACFENWLELATKKRLLEGFMLAKKLWPIYGAFGCYRLMKSIDIQAFRSWYANKPNRLADSFREYIASTGI
jgi:hypothetical protein